jgi:outer membrane receptor protein involved in Fe transport
VVGLGLATVGGEILPSRYDTRAGWRRQLGRDEASPSGSVFAQRPDHAEVDHRPAERATRPPISTSTARPARPWTCPATYDDEQFTQELQLLYEGDRLQGVLGVYYLDGEANNSFDTILGLANLDGGLDQQLTTKSVAAFGDFSFDVTEQLSVSVGRAVHARREDRPDLPGQLRGSRAGSPQPHPRGHAACPDAPAHRLHRLARGRAVHPAHLRSYEFNPDLTGYVSSSKGFKSGGFDPRGDAIFTPSTVEGFDPETVDAYEVGLKGSLLDRRLNFAVAAFASEYQDQQVTSQQPVVSPGVGVASFVGQRRSVEDPRLRSRGELASQRGDPDQRRLRLHRRPVRGVPPLRPDGDAAAAGRHLAPGRVPEHAGVQRRALGHHHAPASAGAGRGPDHALDQLPFALLPVRVPERVAGPAGLHPGRT